MLNLKTMKNFQSAFFSIVKETCSAFFVKDVWIFVFVSQILFFGCTTLIKEEAIKTIQPYDKPIASINLESDSNGIALLLINKLQLDYSKPFNIAFRALKHGSFDVLDDSLLVYHADKLDNWLVDSGYIQVFQMGKNKEGFVKIFNSIRTTIPTPFWPITVLKGTPLTDMNPFLVNFYDSRNFNNLKGMEVAGAEVDSIWGFVLSANINSSKKSINYLAGGGPGNFLNFGTDHIYYRIKRPNDLYFRGMIPILIGDTAQPNAQNDEITLPTGIGFISWTSLLSNDVGTSPVSPRLPVSMRLEPLTYEGVKTKNSQFGTIKDSLQNGQPAFYYKRLATGTQADTTFVFMEEGPGKRITRGRLILKKQ